MEAPFLNDTKKQVPNAYWYSSIKSLKQKGENKMYRIALSHLDMKGRETNQTDL